jgi:hypothetical protein
VEHAREEAGLAAQETMAGGTGFGRAGGAGIDGLAGGHRLPVVGGFVRRADHRRVGDAVVFLLARGGDGETVRPIWRGYLPARFAGCLLDSDRHEHYFRCFLVFCRPGVTGVGATLVHHGDADHALTSLGRGPQKLVPNGAGLEKSACKRMEQEENHH